jgi:hypothetical protein
MKTRQTELGDKKKMGIEHINVIHSVQLVLLRFRVVGNSLMTKCIFEIMADWFDYRIGFYYDGKTLIANQKAVYRVYYVQLLVIYLKLSIRINKI